MPFWKTAGALASGAGKSAWGLSKFAISPAMWGRAAAGQSSSLLGALGKRALGPGIILGAFGLLSGARNLISGGYSATGPGVAWGHTPGMATPYTDTTMTFGTVNRMSQNMGATGSLAFALHNQRKA